MKYLILFALALPFCSISQDEFESDSPYMYDSKTIVQLKSIVDSLNLKFMQCDLDREFRSKRQAHGWQVSLKGNRSKELEKALKNSPSIDEVKKAFPKATFTKSVFVEYAYSNYDDEKKIKIYGYPGETSRSFDDTKKIREDLRKGKWISRYTDYSDKERLRAFFFEEDFTTSVLPDKYARMIQYVDCMVDTNSQVMLEEADYGRYDGLPANYQSLSLKEKKTLLDEKRMTRVMGGCSQDQSPRFHARDIAILSAEALEWSIFLRSHLNVMNDRFERASDGSYAWAGRGTYIRELEELDIDIQSLIIGISLRVDNPADNHYHGSISRVGRALSESDQLDRFHELMSDMMNDESLDDYNKILIYYLWRNSNSYALEKDQAEREENLRKASAGLPDYFVKYLEEEADK
jgi:hypothetical protein